MVGGSNPSTPATFSDSLLKNTPLSYFMHSDYARAALTQMGIVPFKVRQPGEPVVAESKPTTRISQEPKSNHQRQADSQDALEKLKSKMGRVQTQDLDGKILINFPIGPEYQTLVLDVLKALGLDQLDTHCSANPISQFTGQTFSWTQADTVVLSGKELQTPPFDQWNAKIKADLWLQISRN